MELSKRTEDVIAECRWIAEKLQNDFIGLKHFYLAYRKQSFKDKYNFKLTLTEKKDLVRSVKGIKLAGRKDDLFPLTKDFENALTTSDFHKWILRDKEIDPIHVFLSAVSEDIANKDIYLQTLYDNGIKYGYFKRRMIDMDFNKVFRIFRIEKLLSKIF